MMNIQNLALQESVEVKYIIDICAKFCLKRLFENNCYFCNVTESKFQTINHFSSEAAVRKCSSKYLILIISHRCFPVNIGKFKNSIFIENLRWLFFQFDKVTIQHCASADLLFLIKNNVGWFLLKRFVDLFRVCYIISRNHSSRVLSMNLQETKTCPR